MKSVFWGFGILLVGFYLGHFVAMNQQPQFSVPMNVEGKSMQPSQDTLATQQAAPISDNDFTRIYQRLGLKGGDTIYDVNGIATPSGFLNLVAAFNAGNVCVRYQRDNEGKRKVCIVQSNSGQQFSDKESD